jgi:hypothetical protein
MRWINYSLLAALLALTGCRTTVPQEDSFFSFRVRTDRDVYKVGDPIVISCVLENRSGETARLYRGSETVAVVHLLEGQGAEARRVMTSMSGRFPGQLTEADFLPLGPGGTHQFDFRGQVRDGNFTSVHGERLDGLHVQFRDFALWLNGPGEKRIWVNYYAGEYWAQEAVRRLGLDGVYAGELDSHLHTLVIE